MNQTPSRAERRASKKGRNPSKITQVLHDYDAGIDGAFDELVALVYGDLRHLAQVQLAKREGGALRTTDLVHELYLKLVDGGGSWNDRNHFFAACATAMRNILIDTARAAASQKRGGRQADLPLAEAILGRQESDAELLLAVDQALERLASSDGRLARIFELHYFGGYSTAEVAEILDVSRRTAQRDWQRARAWVRAMMDDHPPEAAGAPP